MLKQKKEKNFGGKKKIRYKGVIVILFIVWGFQLGGCEKGKEGESASVTNEEIPTDEEIVSYGCVVMDPEIQKAIVRFNKLNSDVEIVIKDYGKEAGNDAETAITQMNLDILNGTAPDILALPFKCSMDLYVQKGVLENLYPYMDEDETLSREDFLPNILEAYEKDGNLYALPVAFELDTLLGKASVLGDKVGWTLDEMVAFVDSCQPEASVFKKASKWEIMKICMTANWNKFVDWNNSEDIFDIGEYKKILEFSNRFQTDEKYVEDTKYWQRIGTGDLLLYPASLCSGTDGDLYSGFFGEKVVFKGYPCDDGSGSLIKSYTTTSINSRSQHKESAWKFVSTLLQEEYYEQSAFVRGFSVRKDILEKQLEESMSQGWGTYSIGADFVMEIKPATQESVDNIKSLIKGADRLASYDYEIMNILMEEAEMYFAGSKSVDEVVEIAENRIQMYVNENR